MMERGKGMEQKVLHGMGSVAYDLDHFAVKPKLKVKKPTLVPLPAQTARRKFQWAAALKITAALAVVIAIVAVMLYNRAMLTELTVKINSANKELAEMQSENTRLQAELESKISLRNVEDYATQTLGLAKMDKYQIEYIDLNEGDKIELTPQSPKLTLIDRIKLAINNAKEYMDKE